MLLQTCMVWLSFFSEIHSSKGDVHVLDLVSTQEVSAAMQ